MSVYSEAYKAAVEAPELNVTSAVLMAAARHLGEACRAQSDAYMKCRFENEGQPDKCLAEGAAVTSCGISLIEKLKAHCGQQFEAQWKCLDKNNQKYDRCRPTQSALDECVFEKLGLKGSFKTYDTSMSNSSYSKK